MALFVSSAQRCGRFSRTAVSCLAVVGSLALLTLPPANAQSVYPNRNVKIIVAFAPGGIADVTARLIGKSLSDRLGQTVIVENHGGAGGLIAAKLVSTAPADGYTLLVTTTAVVISALAAKNSVDPTRQLTPLGQVASAPDIFAVHQSVGNKSMGEFLAAKKDGQFTYSTAGVGTLEHLTSEFVFKKQPGLHATHVPFLGGTPAISAVLGQQVDMTVASVPSAMPFIKDGGVKLVAVASHSRNATVPDVPTLAEAGFTDLESASWIAMFAPPGVPDPIVQTLSKEINVALDQAVLRERLKTLGFDIRKQTQAEFASYLKDEMTKWGDIIKTIGFTLDK